MHGASIAATALALILTGPTLAQPTDPVVNIDAFAETYAFRRAPDTNLVLRLTNDVSQLVIEPGSRKLFFDGTLLWLNGAVEASGTRWMVTRCDADNVVRPLIAPLGILADQDLPRTVIIDPGHGGEDSGAVGPSQLLEKKVVLDIAKRTSRCLRVDGLSVRLTRGRDYALPLSSRIQKTRETPQDIFVSIHINSASNVEAAGIETYVAASAAFPSTAGNSTGGERTYVSNRHDAVNTILAYLVHSEVVRATTATDRGVKRARFDVIRDADCPALLLECGFASNPKEEDLLSNSAYRQAIAQAIARGILRYVAMARTSHDLTREAGRIY